MNDTLKVAGRIGAELGAAKAENERLRRLLRQLRALLANSSYRISGTAAFLHSIDAALSQQAEPTDTYTAVEMATAAAQGFRDGQAAVEQAAVQDELPAGGVTIEKDIFGTVHIKMGDFDYIQIQYQYPYTDNASQNALAKRIAELLTRPAQTAPQPEQSGLVEAAQGALAEIQAALEDAYLNAYQECCGQAYLECCGSPVQAWSEADQKVMDRFAQHERALRAALSAQRGDA